MDSISNPWERNKSGHILEFTLLPHHIVWDVYKITDGDQVLTWVVSPSKLIPPESY
ncbi:hypothetical protein MJO29_009531 [Puccinia striiformis f. sp. tritici]|nr:hypothetical protein MJO29_009531 [Puccinia striiformis f. sp. tritici]